jgi:hypothetical protein
MAQHHTQEDLSDPFDTLLTLEDTLYTTAYSLGSSDGAHAGRIEGRIFGLEKGFEKFAELGQLHGRSVVWGARLPSLSSTPSKGEAIKPEAKELPPLASNPRLTNNITLLHALTDPETFDTANSEEAVADFDDRFKRAGAKAKVVERILGETTTSSKSPDGSPAASGKTGPIRVSGDAKKKASGGKGDDNFEDFLGGSKVLS